LLYVDKSERDVADERDTLSRLEGEAAAAAAAERERERERDGQEERKRKNNTETDETKRNDGERARNDARGEKRILLERVDEETARFKGCRLPEAKERRRNVRRVNGSRDSDPWRSVYIYIYICIRNSNIHSNIQIHIHLQICGHQLTTNPLR